MQTSKAALLALTLAIAAVAAASTEVSEATLKLHPEITEDDMENELIDVLPSQIERDPNAYYPVATGDDEIDALESINAVQMSDSEDSQVAEGDSVGWREPQGVKMCSAYAVGDPHFRSFDGQIFHFQGVGQFELINCNNLQMQARNSVCGKHKTYGVVCCWLAAAIKFTGDDGATDVVEVTTRGAITFKVNGHSVANQDKAMKLKHCEVVPTWYRTNGRSYKRVYVYCPGHQQIMVTSYAIYARRPCCSKCLPALLGNDNCQSGDDYTDFDDKDWDKLINSDNKAQDVANKIDNDKNKPLRKWGLTFMVDDKKIKSFFGDAAKAYNHKELAPSPIKCDDKEFKKKAHKLCKDAALSYQFYQDCMMDACATKKLDDSLRDIDAQKMFNEMREKDQNHHDGKVNLLKTLGKMEVDFLTQRDQIQEAMKEEADHVKGLGLKLGQAEKQEKADCGVVPPARADHDQKVNDKEVAKGKLAGADKALRDAIKEHDDTYETIKKEDALVRSMLNVLTKLTSVERPVNSLEDLDIDHETLNTLPKLKSIVSAAIEESRHHRGAKGNTDTIRKLLVELLYKLDSEKKRLDNNKERAIKEQKDAKDDLDDKTDKADKAKAVLDDSIQRCEERKKDREGANGAYRAAQFDQAKNNEERGKQLTDLADEADMVKHLQDTIKDWSKNKNKKPEKCPKDEEDIETAPMTDAEYDAADKAIFMEDDVDTTSNIQTEAPLDADQAVLDALEEDY